jgi:hypothetical protein
MLVAKYAKVFSRTGTQPFLFTCHVGGQTEDRKFKSLRAICSPLASTPQNSVISRIAIYLAAQVVGVLCLRIFRDLEKSGTLWTILPKRFPHCRRA